MKVKEKVFYIQELGWLAGLFAVISAFVIGLWQQCLQLPFTTAKTPANRI